MTYTILWSIDNCEYSNNPINGLDKVIVSANYRVNAIDSEILQPIGIILGTTSLVSPNPSSFTPLNQVTSSMIVEWVKESLGVDGVNKIEYDAVNDLYNKLNPPTTIYIPPT